MDGGEESEGVVEREGSEVGEEEKERGEGLEVDVADLEVQGEEGGGDEAEVREELCKGAWLVEGTHAEGGQVAALREESSQEVVVGGTMIEAKGVQVEREA